jgi:hypothetical protein
MDTNKNIVIGEWFCAYEGIAIAERIHDFYYEEYNHIPEGKKVGDYNFSMLEYKLFCDYDGKPIKRNRFKEFNKDYCSTLNKKWEKVLNNSIKKHPKEYESFVKFLKEPKRTYSDVMVFYEVPEDKKLQVAQDMERIQKSLPEKFTFEDFIKKGEEFQCAINLKTHLGYGEHSPIYLRIMMGYTYGDFAGKRVLFDRFIYKICDMQK